MDLNVDTIKVKSLLEFTPYLLNVPSDKFKKRLAISGKLEICNGDIIDATANSADLDYIYLFSEKALDFPGLYMGEEPIYTPSPRVFVAFELLRDGDENRSLYSYSKEPVELTIDELKKIAEEQLGRKVSIQKDQSKCRCSICEGGDKHE